eukprot:1482611-Lingulodinium_polyedra.AAC.1
MIGEKLFLAIARRRPALAGRITGMMLELSNGDLFELLESEQMMDNMIAEALQVIGNAEPLAMGAQPSGAGAAEADARGPEQSDGNPPADCAPAPADTQSSATGKGEMHGTEHREQQGSEGE